MKKLLITYSMTRGDTEAETCIVLPFADDRAENLLRYQEESALISGPGYEKGLLATTLDRLAKLQGYHYAQMICADYLPIED